MRGCFCFLIRFFFLILYFQINLQFHSFCWCEWSLTPLSSLWRYKEWTAASVVASAMNVCPNKMRKGERMLMGPQNMVGV